MEQEPLDSEIDAKPKKKVNATINDAYLKHT